MNSLTDLARHWLRQTELGRGLRLEADQLDLLNAIGVGDIIAAEAAKHLREQCQKRTLRSIRGGNTASNGIEGETGHSEAHSSRSSGTMPQPAAIEAAARARRRSSGQRTR
jgi:hypothetical protein